MAFLVRLDMSVLLVKGRRLLVTASEQNVLDAQTDVNCTNSEVTNIEALSSLTKVEKVNLAFNKISSLSCFRCCERLHTLHVSHNRLSSLEGIPSSAGSLRTLTCSHNAIMSLEPLRGARNLENLWVQRNAIRSLAELGHLRGLTRLQSLVFRPNPATKTCTPETYRYYVIATVPSLQKLDGAPVDAKERERALAWSQSSAGLHLVRSLGKGTTATSTDKTVRRATKAQPARPARRSHSRDRRRKKMEQFPSRRQKAKASVAPSSAVPSATRRELKPSRRPVVQKKRPARRRKPPRRSSRGEAVLSERPAPRQSSPKLAPARRQSSPKSISAIAGAVSSLPTFVKPITKPRSYLPPPVPVAAPGGGTVGSPSRRRRAAADKDDYDMDATTKYLQDAKKRVAALAQMQGVAALQLSLAANIRKRMQAIEQKLEDADRVSQKRINDQARAERRASPKNNSRGGSSKVSTASKPLKSFNQILKERSKKLKAAEAKRRLNASPKAKKGGSTKSRIGAAMAAFDRDTNAVFDRLRNKLGWEV